MWEALLYTTKTTGMSSQLQSLEGNPKPMQKLKLVFAALALLMAPAAWASNFSVVAVPEPSTMMLLGTGLAALVPLSRWLKR